MANYVLFWFSLLLDGMAVSSGSREARVVTKDHSVLITVCIREWDA